jgi:hypothetical protein
LAQYQDEVEEVLQISDGPVFCKMQGDHDLSSSRRKAIRGILGKTAICAALQTDLDFPATSGIMPMHGGSNDAAPFTTNLNPQRTKGDSSRHSPQSQGPPDLLACPGDRASIGGDCRA